MRRRLGEGEWSELQVEDSRGCMVSEIICIEATPNAKLIRPKSPRNL